MTKTVFTLKYAKKRINR